MAGASQDITITVEDAELKRNLRELVARVQRPERALREIGETLVSSTKERFRPGNQASPAGHKWAENSPVTKARKNNPNILTRDGFLGDTIRWQLTPDGQGVEVGSDRVYAAMQQFGGTKAMWPHLWGNIPARPFLGISTEDRAEILAVLSDYLGV